MACCALACVILSALAGPARAPRTAFHGAIKAHRASSTGRAEKWCTSSEAQIECDDQSVIRVKAAFYSRRQIKSCQPIGSDDTELESCAVNATDMVVGECEATRQCQVPASSNPFCATAPFTFIRIAWECRPGEPELARAELDETMLTHQRIPLADAALRKAKGADNEDVEVVRKTKETVHKESQLRPEPVIKIEEPKNFRGGQIKVVSKEHLEDQGDEPAEQAAPSVAPMTLFIGPSDSGTKCVKAAGISCPIDSGDRFKRVNQDHKEFDDAFHITKESNGDICARRTDLDEAWAMNLMLSCTVDLAQLPTDEVALVTVGPSETNTKCVWGKGFYCAPDSGDQGHRVNIDHQTFPDSFDIVQDSNSDICATRTDSNEGWHLNLLLACKMVSNPLPKVMAPGSTVVITVGQSGSGKKCVGVEKGVWCAADSGNKPKRVNTDYPKAPDVFNIEMAPNGDVCAMRVDAPIAWGMTLQLTCTIGQT